MQQRERAALHAHSADTRKQKAALKARARGVGGWFVVVFSLGALDGGVYHTLREILRRNYTASPAPTAAE
jgi:hypothetical protein